MKENTPKYFKKLNKFKKYYEAIPLLLITFTRKRRNSGLFRFRWKERNNSFNHRKRSYRSAVISKSKLKKIENCREFNKLVLLAIYIYYSWQKLLQNIRKLDSFNWLIDKNRSLNYGYFIALRLMINETIDFENHNRTHVSRHRKYLLCTGISNLYHLLHHFKKTHRRASSTSYSRKFEVRSAKKWPTCIIFSIKLQTSNEGTNYESNFQSLSESLFHFANKKSAKETGSQKPLIIIHL